MRHKRLEPQTGLMHALLYLPVIGIVLMPGVFRGQKKKKNNAPHQDCPLLRREFHALLEMPPDAVNDSVRDVECCSVMSDTRFGPSQSYL